MSDTARVHAAGSSERSLRLDQLPVSITQHIASYLDERGDALSLAVTCRALVDAGESRLYRTLPLYCFTISRTYVCEPDISHARYRPSAKALERAKHLGDPMYQQDLVEWRLTVDPDNPRSSTNRSPDILQGCLRYFNRLFASRPQRRNHVKEVYIDTSQATPDIARSFAAMGTLKAVNRVVLVVGMGWTRHLSLAVALAPNIRSLTILTTIQRAEPEREIELSILELRSLTIESISKKEEKVVAQIIKQSVKLSSLSILSWSGAWRPSVDDPIGKALTEKRGVTTLILPKTAFEPEQRVERDDRLGGPGSPPSLRIGTTGASASKLDIDRMVKVRTLGIQADHPPTLRLTDLVVPAFPRYNVLSLVKNRGSSSTPVQAVHEVSSLPTPIPPAHISSTILEMLDAAPCLTHVESAKSGTSQNHQQDRILIRTFSRPGETFTHIRVLSSQVFLDGRWVRVSKDGSQGMSKVWQDWTDYRGRLIPLQNLAQVFECLGRIPRPARDIQLSDAAWGILERCVSM